MELLFKRLQAKEAEIAQYLTIIESLQKQLNSLKEENDQCTKNEKNQKKLSRVWGEFSIRRGSAQKAKGPGRDPQNMQQACRKSFLDTWNHRFLFKFVGNSRAETICLRILRKWPAGPG